MVQEGEKLIDALGRIHDETIDLMKACLGHTSERVEEWNAIIAYMDKATNATYSNSIDAVNVLKTILVVTKVFKDEKSPARKARARLLAKYEELRFKATAESKKK
jgi:hypothetical protein